MGTVRFRPANNRARVYNILLRFRYANKELTLSTGISVDPSKWDKRRQRVKGRTIAINKQNQLLTYIEQKVYDLFETYRTDHLQFPNHEHFKILLKKELFKKAKTIESKPQKKSFKTFIRELIDSRAEMSKSFAATTISGYETTFSHLENFAKDRAKKLDWPLIDRNFADDFFSYLVNETDVNSPNSVLKYLKNVRTFLNAAKDDEIISSHRLKIGKSNVKGKKLRKIYLTQKEIDKLYNHSFSGQQAKVRDLAVAARYTGLRFQDWHKASLDRSRVINGKAHIGLPTQKTGEIVYIPLHDQLKEILERNGGRVPKPSSNQKTNDMLKLICRKAGITNTEYLMVFKDGKIIEKKVQKCDAVSTHAMRRTAATLLYLDGIPIDLISMIIGHMTQNGSPNTKQTLEYISATGVDKAILLSKHFK